MQGCISFIRRFSAPLLAVALVMGLAAPSFTTGVTLPETGVDAAGAIAVDGET